MFNYWQIYAKYYCRNSNIPCFNFQYTLNNSLIPTKVFCRLVVLKFFCSYKLEMAIENWIEVWFCTKQYTTVYWIIHELECIVEITDFSFKEEKFRLFFFIYLLNFFWIDITDQYSVNLTYFWLFLNLFIYQIFFLAYLENLISKTDISLLDRYFFFLLHTNYLRKCRQQK